MSTATEGGSAAALAVEQNGINVIHESERKGAPRDLFWPWAAANISVFGIAYGAFLLYFGVSFWQALIVGAVGIAVSFFFVGVIALAGKRGSAPTLVLSRAIFGVDGNRVPSILSWVLTVGWETVLVSLAVLATSTVLGALGFDAGVGTQVVALVVVAALVIGAGVMGFDLIMRLQKWITIATGVLTVVYVVLVLPQIDLDAVLSQGYCFQIDMLWHAQVAGLRIREVPFTFPERERGSSKMSGAIVVEAMLRVTEWAIGSLPARIRHAFRKEPASVDAGS